MYCLKCKVIRVVKRYNLLTKNQVYKSGVLQDYARVGSPSLSMDFQFKLPLIRYSK